MPNLLIASTNAGKVNEITAALAGVPYTITSLAKMPPLPHIAETGSTYSENAFIKARSIGQITQQLTLADDSGLQVETLEGRPGLYSARYGGNDKARITRLLAELQGVPERERRARFVCAMVLYDPLINQVRRAEGVIDGYITIEAKGSNGFGFDPIFYVPLIRKTLAEATTAEKNAVSHRGRALKIIRSYVTV